MPRNIVGPPVAGDDCFGRDAFVKELALRLQHASVLISAPRRWGKSSVLRVLRDGDPATRHYFDLYPVEHVSQFLAEVAANTAGPVARVRQWAGGFLGDTLGRVKEIRVSEVAVELRERLAKEPNWQDVASRLFASFPSNHVLILDEFPVMVKRILDRDAAEGAALLHWLRRERQRDGAPRFVFAGSTSLVELCRQVQLSHTINDLQPMSLPPFDTATASALLRGLFEAEGVPLSRASLRASLELVGPEVPFFLQVLTSAVLAAVRDTHARVTPELIRKTYQVVLLSPDSRANMDDFQGRLDRYYLPAEHDVAIIVLNVLSRRREGMELGALRNEVVGHGADERLLERVLALLRGDFYISEDETGRYRFLNRYLADWWQRFHA
jgi:uncharacterized protein